MRKFGPTVRKGRPDTFEQLRRAMAVRLANAAIRREQRKNDIWYLHRWLFSKVEGDPDGCWNFTCSKTNEGYGRVRVNKRSVLAHRLAFKITNGYLPDDKLVCHKCDNPSCINPQHLFLGTNRDNVHDSINKGRRHCQKVKSL